MQHLKPIVRNPSLLLPSFRDAQMQYLHRCLCSHVTFSSRLCVSSPLLIRTAVTLD